MGALFESLVKNDDRFELSADRHLGLVSFRLKVKFCFFSGVVFLFLMYYFQGRK
jgi:hypothetical protein